MRLHRFSSWMVAVVALVAAAAPSVVHAQLSVDPIELHLRLDSDSLTQVFTVRNDSDSLQQVRITFADWQRDSAGTNVFGPIGSQPNSCGDRVDVFPRTFQLERGASQFVRLTYKGSSPGPFGCWTIAFAEAVRPPVTAGRPGSAVSIQIMTGVKIYFHPPNGRVEGAIEYAEVETSWVRKPGAAPTDTMQVRDVVVRFSNTGTDHMILRTSAELRDESTAVVARLTAADAYLTPDAFRDVALRIPETLARGRYVAIVLLDFGGADIQAAQVEFEIP